MVSPDTAHHSLVGRLSPLQTARMRTLLAVVAVILLSCGDDKPVREKGPAGPPAFAPDRAAADQVIDGGVPDAR